MSAEDDNKLVDEYLADDPGRSAGDSDLTRQYRNLDKPEPPAHMDRAILSQARAAAHDSQRHSKSLFWSAWMRPISAVAFLGVCLALVLEVMQSNENALLTNGAEFKMSADDVSAGTGDDRSDTENLVIEAPPAAKAFADSAPELPSAVAPAYELDEVVLSARKSEESLQEAPLSASMEIREQESAFAFERDSQEVSGIGSSAREPSTVLTEMGGTFAGGAAVVDSFDADDLHEELIGAARKSAVAESPTENVYSGAYPAQDVWSAGIDAVKVGGDIELGEAELKKLNAAYPDSVIVDSAIVQSPHLAAPKSTATLQIEPPVAEVWLAGIEYLRQQNDTARVEQELAKFRLAYPNNPASVDLEKSD